MGEPPVSESLHDAPWILHRPQGGRILNTIGISGRSAGHGPSWTRGPGISVRRSRTLVVGEAAAELTAARGSGRRRSPPMRGGLRLRTDSIDQAQYESDEITSLPATVPSARQVRPLTESLM